MSGSSQARRRDALIDFSKVSEAGCETDRVNPVFLLLMNLDDIIDTDIAELRNNLKIGARFCTVINR